MKPRYNTGKTTLKKLSEKVLTIHMTAVNSVVENQGEFVEAFRENIIWVIGNYSTKNVSTKYDQRIEQLQGRLLTLIEDNAKQGLVTEEFDEQYQSIAEEKKLKLVQEQRMALDYEQRLESMDHCIGKVNCKLGEFDNNLIRRLLLRIRVINENKIEIHFKSGIVIEQPVTYYE